MHRLHKSRRFFSLFIVKKRLFLFFFVFFCFVSINREPQVVDVLYIFNLLTRRRPANTKGVHFSTNCTNVLILQRAHLCTHISFTFLSFIPCLPLTLSLGMKIIQSCDEKKGNPQKILVVKRRKKNCTFIKLKSVWHTQTRKKMPERQAIST